MTATTPAFLSGQQKFSDESAWLTKFREENWQAFLKQGVPDRKNEYWKYDDLGFLAHQQFSAAPIPDEESLIDVMHQHRLRSGDGILLVMVNGHFMPFLSDLIKLPMGITVCSINQALQTHADCIENYFPELTDVNKYPFAALNAAQFTDGLFLKMDDNVQLKSPLHLLSLNIGKNNFMASCRNLILMGKDSECILVEEYFSSVEQMYFMNIATTMHLANNAKLQHYKLQQENNKAVHIANHSIHQQQDSYYSHLNVSCGAQFSRDDLVIRLNETGAKCNTGGFYYSRNNAQTIDNHVDITHAAKHSQSEMLYKGILDNQSRAIFNGRLHVEKDAQQILAYQGNHNLLLSRQAEVYSKPELEIYADDVKCKHGATTGQLDQDALFYLRSRGIPERESMKILLEGFAEEILDRITHPGIRSRVQEAL